jgi:hypothetical protein
MRARVASAIDVSAMTALRASMDVSLPGKTRRVHTRFGHGLSLAVFLVVVSGLVSLLSLPPAAATVPSGVVLNEVNCTGTDWVELINVGTAEASLANWVLTDDPLDRVPLRDSHRMHFAAGTVLAPGARLVVSAGTGGFPFGLSCGDDTLRLADAAGAPVDAFTLPVLATGGMTFGRVPDGTGGWALTVPTPGTANAAAPDTSADDPAWLFDPLQVTRIDLEASPAALAQLAAVSDEYVEGRITLRSGATTYGPYLVGLRLKGHSAFRPLEGKAAFKVKFGFVVPGQSFHGLKSLTLNNMVQDSSMIAEATSSLLLRAVGAPPARVGYAYVRLNGDDYGLYADVETVDAVMARHWFTGTQHLYESGGYGVDVHPGGAGWFQVDEGSSTDTSDYEALAEAGAAGADDWWARMQQVADMTEMTRTWAAEHYIGHWDGYSVGASQDEPNNFYLHSDPSGRFTMIASGTDQTWLARSPFGVYGQGELMRRCAEVDACRQRYVESLRELAASPAVAALPAQARAIRDLIAPWRALDPRREQTVAEGEAQAEQKIATMDGRPAALAAWLASPSFVDALAPPEPESGGGDGGSTVPSPAGPTPVAGPAPSITSAPLVVRPLLGKPVGVPAKPLAGKEFSFSLPVTRSDTGGALLTGKMVCDPSVAGKVIKHAESFKGGKARLSFVVPKTAEGKLLKVKITITASGQSAGRTYSYTVR